MFRPLIHSVDERAMSHLNISGIGIYRERKGRYLIQWMSFDMRFLKMVRRNQGGKLIAVQGHV